MGLNSFESCCRIDSMSNSTGVETRRASGLSFLSDAFESAEEKKTKQISMKCKCLNLLCCCGYLAEGWARSDEFQDNGVRVFLDAGRNGPIHHDLTQFVASRSDVIHHHLIGRQFVLVRFAGAFASRRRLQLYPVTQLTDHLHPQSRLSSR